MATVSLYHCLGVIATCYINRLEEAAIWLEFTGRARNRVYRADRVLAAIEEPLGQAGEPSP